LGNLFRGAFYKFFMVLDFPRLTRSSSHFGDYFWSSVYLSFPFAARLAGPDGVEDSAWYQRPSPGFRNTERVNKWLCENVYDGAAISRIFYLFLGRFFLLVVLVALLFSRRRRVGEGACFSISGISMKPGSECEHFLFSGSPGSGKSTAIKELLDQIRAKKQRAIVFDPSGEYIGPYFREGVDVLMNPLDQRFRPWTLWAEVRQSTDYISIARSLFPPGGREPFWNDAGAALFAAASETLAERNLASNARLYELLTSATISELASFLSNTSAAKFLDPSAGAMPSNLIATVTTKVGSWRLLKDPEEGVAPFSIRRFIEDDAHDSWLFLAMRSDHEAALRPLVSLWCDLASTAILSLPPDRNRRFWVVLDEVATLQRLPALEPLMAKGRKHGAAVILGLQSMAQLRDSYGRDAADALTSQPQTWLVLRTVEPGTSRWLEQALGEAEVDETRESISMGADNIRDGVSFAQNTRKTSIVMAAEIAGLPALEGFLKLSGDSSIYRIKLAIKKRPAISPIYVAIKSPSSSRALGVFKAAEGE
jgi:type IV conjugative transfer system coupling protein TraD